MTNLLCKFPDWPSSSLHGRSRAGDPASSHPQPQTPCRYPYSRTISSQEKAAPILPFQNSNECSKTQRYASYALANPKLCKVVAVAEPREKTREIFAKNHSIPETGIFNSYDDLLAASQKLREETGKRIADAVVVAVQDKLHVEVVLKCVTQGFDILCEKPMATTPEDCIAMADAVANAKVIFGMGHVLRYSPYNHRLVETIRSGELGQLINVVQIEPVGHQHFAHSYVRGNWAKEADSSFSLMTKSCHNGCLGWPASVLTDGPPDIENITHALKTGPYGKCVYESDNDVADHQVVNIEFSTGATVSLTMVAFSTLICDRQTRLHFTHGEIVGDMYTLVITNFKYPPGHPSRTTRLTPKIEDGGHGGGDLGLVRAFVKGVRERDQSVLGTDVLEVLRSHLIVFAAEKGRREGKVVGVREFEAEVRKRIQEKIEGVAVSSEGYPAAAPQE
ncbi:hypothetical protein M407DRAFT_16270 [Tulasnella calospora MUT 4182]|uniref:Gfo/Idh/MocA-like oxidoreductase N-terminal domain-containing protein n=1 Tax=Tulasnella calospora MUT 4182 TaxID=1051891 RepID=A0A0C3K9W0_9AGAM|nr:hypothetical protein M407DRAFT_16270 [Tulasnella calospora MUT 4182]